MPSAKKVFSIGLVSLFLLTISIPLAAFLVLDKPNISRVEKRTLAPRPDFPGDLRSLARFPQQFEQYFNDHFGFRNSFVNLYALAKTAIGDTLGVNINEDGSVTRNVIRGKQGWYFLNRKWDGDPLSDYRNIDLYSPPELLRAGLALAARKHWLEERGIKYVLFFAPNKHTIYAEYLPDYIVKQGDVSAMDQLYGFLRRHTSVAFVDLRPPLIRAKAEVEDLWPKEAGIPRIYWKTDSHWNKMGANIAQYVVAGKIETMLPGKIEPREYEREDFYFGKSPGPGDLAALINDKSLFGEMGPFLREKGCAAIPKTSFDQHQQLVTRCPEGKVNAVIFHDSFFTALIPFFADYFATTSFVWERLNQADLQKQVRQYQPAIVIEELAERFLPYIPDLLSENYPGFWAGIFKRSRQSVYVLDTAMLSKGREGRKYFNAALQENQARDQLHITAKNNDPHIYLPDIPFRPDRLYILRIEITAPAETYLQLFFSRKGAEDAFPAEQNSGRYRLKKGSNVLFIPLLSGDLGKRLRLDPGMKAGTYVLKDFEVRHIEPEAIE